MANDYGAAKGAYLALENYRDGQMLKLSAATTAAYFIALGSLLGAGLAIIASPLFGAAALAAGVLFAFAFIVAIVAYIYAKLGYMHRSMEIVRIPLPKNRMPFMQFLALYLRLLAINSLCWYDKRLLAPSAALLAFGLLAIAAGILGGAAKSGMAVAGIASIILAVIAWSLAYYVHSFRTGFSKFQFLRGDAPEHQAPLESNSLVLGQTFEVFTAQYLVSELLQIASSAVFTLGIALALVPMALVLLLASGAWIVAAAVAGVCLLAILFAFNTLYMSYSGIYAADVFKYFDSQKKAHARKP